MEKFLEQLKIKLLELQILLFNSKLTVPKYTPDKIIIHHGAGKLNFDEVNNYHKQKWGFKSYLGYYIGYQYFIERDGKIYQGRDDGEEGAHTIGQNKTSIGICLQGNGEEYNFTDFKYSSLKNLVKEKCQQYNIDKEEIYGHRDFSSTACPSNRLYYYLTLLKQ